MILEVFSLFDAKAEGYMRPFSSHNVQTATRDFGVATLDGNTDVAKNPEDFTLYHIGSFDTLTGIQSIKEPIEQIINGLVLQNSQLDHNRKLIEAQKELKT